MKSYKKMVNSEKETTRELYEAIASEEHSTVDNIEEGNMNPVTSNAVAKAMKSSFLDKVTITVVDKATHAPIVGAIVKLEQNTQITDDKGSCTFENVVKGMHILKITHPNYATDYIEGIKLDSKEIQIELGEASINSVNLNITVKNKNTGEIISGAVVIVGDQTLASDEKGKCTFKCSQNTTYTIRTSYTDYEQYTSDITVKDKDMDYTVKMMPINHDMFRITGTVFDARGVLPDVSVREAFTGVTMNTSEKGEYTLKIPRDEIRDKLELDMYKEGYTTLRVPISYNEEDSYEDGGKILSISKNASKTATIQGKAIYYEEDMDKPAGNVTIILTNTITGDICIINTSEKGTFAPTEVYPGDYSIKVENNPNYDNKEIKNALFVRPKEKLTDVCLVLSRTTHEFELKVQYKDTMEDIPNTQIEIYSDSETKNMIASGTTNELGKFYFLVSNGLTDDLYAKVYVTDSDVRTVSIGKATASNSKIKI